MAQITIDLTEFDALRDARKAAEENAARLERELIQARLNAGDALTTKGLTKIARSAMTIARFAVANLPPESTRNWPSSALREISELIGILPDYSTDDGEMAGEFRAFASEVERFEKWRASNGKERAPTSSAPFSAVDRDV